MQDQSVVFSVGSSASMQEFDEYSAATLPRMKPKSRVRTFSADVTRRMMNLGVNHFNRYGVCVYVGASGWVGGSKRMGRWEQADGWVQEDG